MCRMLTCDGDFAPLRSQNCCEIKSRPIYMFLKKCETLQLLLWRFNCLPFIVIDLHIIDQYLGRCNVDRSVMSVLSVEPLSNVLNFLHPLLCSDSLPAWPHFTSFENLRGCHIMLQDFITLNPWPPQALYVALRMAIIRKTEFWGSSIYSLLLFDIVWGLAEAF